MCYRTQTFVGKVETWPLKLLNGINHCMSEFPNFPSISLVESAVLCKNFFVLSRHINPCLTDPGRREKLT